MEDEPVILARDRDQVLVGHKGKVKWYSLDEYANLINKELDDG